MSIETQKAFLERSLDPDETVTKQQILDELMLPNAIMILQSNDKLLLAKDPEQIQIDVKKMIFETHDIVVLNDLDGDGTPNKATWRIYVQRHSESRAVINAWPSDVFVKELRKKWAKLEQVDKPAPKSFEARLAEFYELGKGVLEGSSLPRYTNPVTAWAIVPGSREGASVVIEAERNGVTKNESISLSIVDGEDVLTILPAK